MPNSVSMRAYIASLGLCLISLVATHTSAHAQCSPDTESPIIANMPENITQTADPGACGTDVTWTIPTASDNCELFTFASNQVPGDFYAVGITTVTYTAMDASGNMTASSFFITVTDDEDPVISGMPGDLNLSNDAGNCSAVVTWTEPIGSDNCGIGSLTSTHNSGDAFGIGTTTVTYTATDVNGAQVSSSFNVTVTDDENPTLGPMPDDITQAADAGGCTAIVNWTPPTAADNCTVSSLTPDAAPGSSFGIGTTIVTYTATDPAGNSATATFNVTIIDTEAPTINNMPANITQTADAGNCSAVVNWIEPTIADNCALAANGGDYAPGDTFPVGTTTVTYTATDASGNNATAQTFTITVTDDEDPVFSNVPVGVTIASSPSTCDRAVTWTEPTVSDNCPGVTVTSSHSPGDTFPVLGGITTTMVTYTATDAAGNVSTASFEVLVYDNHAPTISGTPADITQSADAGSCSTTVTWTEPTDSDNCGSTLTSTHSPGDSFPVGNTTVTYTSTDAAANTTTASFTVTVTDNEDPTISGLPTDIIQPTDASACTAVVNWTVPTVNDNCTGATITPDVAPGSTFTLGTTLVTYTATDGSSNVTTGAFLVTVIDNEDPAIAGTPADITQTADAGSCTADITWTEPTASDNCTVSSFTSDIASGATFGLGANTVTYTATDNSGNTTTTNFTVTITDNEAPTITGTPADISLSSDAATCSATATWTAPTAADNCGAPTLTSSHNSGDAFTVGTTPVTYTATDASANTVTSSFNVVVTDNTAPTISGMPADITQSTDAGNCTAAVSWTAPTASDNCAVDTFTSDIASGSTFSLGTTPVTYTATDIHGNTASSAFNVTVTDDEAPAINGTADITAYTGAGECSANVTWAAATATDNCTLSSLTATHNSGATFQPGTTAVAYSAIDAAGNVSSASFNVTVLDTISPTISGMPADISQPVDTDSCNAVVTWTLPTADDNCTLISLVGSHTPGDTFNNGATTVTYTATDNSGNTTTNSFTVTISLTESPTISGMPSDISVSADAGICGAAVTWTAPTATGSCGAASLASNYNPGDILPVGTTTVTYTADQTGAPSASGSFNITVTDNEAPIISGMPGDITQDADAGLCAAAVSWTEPAASDNCPGVSLSSNIASGTSFVLGSTPVTYTATDIYGNSITATFNVIVVDNENPTITGTPSDITVNADAGLCTTAVTWTAPTASDNCPGVILAEDIAPGTTFFLGTTEVTYTAHDAAGNTSSTTFNVTVVDNQNPTFSGVPADISVSTDAGSCNAAVTWTEPTPADNCPGVSQTSSHTPGDSFPVGTTPVTYTGTDTSGNTSTATFNVTVTDSENPTISGMPADITVSADAGLCTTAVTWTAPTASDNCAIDTFSPDIASGTTFFLGTTTVTYTATDIYGNSSSSTFDVIVQDNEAPTISGLPADITQQADAGLCTTAVSWTTPTAADNCPGSSISSDIASGTTFFLGTTPVTYTATDAVGNSYSASFNVIVIDNQDPTISGMPSDISVSADAGSCSAAVTWTAPTAADNCPGSTLTSSHAPGSTFQEGTTTVTYTVTDSSGNTATATFNVTVTDDTAPTISGMPADITLDPPPAECDTAVTWTEPSASDNCAMASFTSSHTSGSPLSVGTTTTVTYTATDVNGNSSTASFTITVNDPDFDGDNIGDCTDPDIDNDGSLNADDSDDFNNSICSDTDGDGCEDCAQGGANSYDPTNDGSDSDGDGICDGGDNCSDPLANNYLDPANEECQVCPNAPLFNGISCTNPASTLSSADGAISLDISGNPASTLYLWGINGAPDTVISLPANLNDLQAGYYTTMVQDADGCWGVADTSVGGTTLQQPAIMREIIIPYDICCSGCGINDADADGLCDDGDNCTDQSATNFADPANESCTY